MQREFSATTIIFRVINSKGNIMPPDFFPNGYIHILSKMVKLWIDWITYMWQQNSALYNTSQKTQS